MNWLLKQRHSELYSVFILLTYLNNRPKQVRRHKSSKCCIWIRRTKEVNFKNSVVVSWLSSIDDWISKRKRKPHPRDKDDNNWWRTAVCYSQEGTVQREDTQTFDEADTRSCFLRPQRYTGRFFSQVTKRPLFASQRSRILLPALFNVVLNLTTYITECAAPGLGD